MIAFLNPDMLVQELIGEVKSKSATLPKDTSSLLLVRSY